jgi:tetratricopeptide (TPR) repeat protein
VKSDAGEIVDAQTAGAESPKATAVAEGGSRSLTPISKKKKDGEKEEIVHQAEVVVDVEVATAYEDPDIYKFPVVKYSLRPETEKVFQHITNVYERSALITPIWDHVSSQGPIQVSVIPNVNKLLKGDGSGGFRTDRRQQRGIGQCGAPVRSLDDLYSAAVVAQPHFRAFMKEVVSNVPSLGVGDEADGRLILVPLKLRASAQQKMDKKYSDRFPGPGAAWVMDVVRASVLCKDAKQIMEVMMSLNRTLSARGGMVVQCNNRCVAPSKSGYRDILLKIQLPIDPNAGVGGESSGFADLASTVYSPTTGASTASRTFMHFCEVQLHFEAMHAFDQQNSVFSSYKYLMNHFGGSLDGLNRQFDTLSVLHKYQKSTLVASLEEVVSKGSRHELEPLKELLADKYAEYMMARECGVRMKELLELEVPRDTAWEEDMLKYKTAIADMTYKIGTYRKCLGMYKEIVAKKEDMYSKHSLKLIRAYANLGNCHRVLSEYDPSMDTLQQGQSLYERLAGTPSDPGFEYSEDAAILYTNLGTLYRGKKMHEETLPVLEKALMHYNHTLGPEHEETAIVLGSMGLTLQALGQLKQAEDKFKTALKIKIKTIGPEHYSVASTYFSMGVLYGDAQGDLEKGLEYLAKARQIYVKTVGEKHRSCSNLDAWVKVFRPKLETKKKAAGNSGIRAETEELFDNIAHFFEHKVGMDAVWGNRTTEYSANLFGDIANMTLEEQTEQIFGSQSWECDHLLKANTLNEYNEELRQGRSFGVIGAHVRNIEELYDAAVLALPRYINLMKNVVQNVEGLSLEGQRMQTIADWRGTEDIQPFESRSMNVACLKGQQRSSEKANDDYSERVPGPGIAWVNDVIRGNVICETIHQMKDVMLSLDDEVKKVNGQMVKCKNRCLHCTASGFRDIICKIIIPIPVDGDYEGGELAYFNHTCEVQVHFRGMLDYDIAHNSHKSYEYFRTYFGGNMATVRNQMSTLKMIFDQKQDSLVHTVENILEKGNQYELEGVFGLLSAKVAEYPLALKVAERILSKVEDAYLKNPTDDKLNAKLDAQEKVADMIYKIGDYRKCLGIYREIVDGKEKICGDNTLMLVRPMANLGNCHRVIGQYAESRKILENAQKTFEKYIANVEDEGMEDEGGTSTTDGFFSADAALMYTNLGTLYRREKMHDATLEVLRNALRHYEGTLGAEHEETAIVLGSMGLTLQAMGQLDEALLKFNRALKIKIKTVGPNHYTVASTLFSMGVLFGHAKHNKDKGLEYLSRARDIYVKTVGEKHRSTSNLDAWLKNFGVSDPTTWHLENSDSYVPSFLP